jgi:hypothetical protein
VTYGDLKFNPLWNSLRGSCVHAGTRSKRSRRQPHFCGTRKLRVADQLKRFRPEKIPTAEHRISAEKNLSHDRHPALAEATKINLNSGSIVRLDYRSRTNPPILHRKESFLHPNDPRVCTFSALTKQEEQAGLYRDTSQIGLRHHLVQPAQTAQTEVRWPFPYSGGLIVGQANRQSDAAEPAPGRYNLARRYSPRPPHLIQFLFPPWHEHAIQGDSTRLGCAPSGSGGGTGKSNITDDAPNAVAKRPSVSPVSAYR